MIRRVLTQVISSTVPAGPTPITDAEARTMAAAATQAAGNAMQAASQAEAMAAQAHESANEMVEQTHSMIGNAASAAQQAATVASAAQQAADQVAQKVATAMQQLEQMSATRPAPTVRLASVATPAILLGANADVAVTWSAPMPDADYQVQWAAQAGLLGRSTITLKSKTREGCVINVLSTSLAITSGSIVTLLALDY